MSATPIHGDIYLQELILVGRDGVRASVARVIATEASYVLRDLLDAFPNGDSNNGDDSMTAVEIPTTTCFSGIAEHAAANVPDLTDFFPASTEEVNNGGNAHPARSQATLPHESYPNIMDKLFSDGSPAPAAEDDQHPSQTPRTKEPVVIPFPSLSGDILQKVCQHMSYRYRVSSFGTVEGYYRVYPVRTHEIPKPMTLPLTEYLDDADRQFIQDWDELTTVLMVKAATLLNYEDLLRLASAKLASYLCEKNVEGIRTLLGVEGNFSAAEETELKKEQVGEALK